MGTKPFRTNGANARLHGNERRRSRAAWLLWGVAGILVFGLLGRDAAAQGGLTPPPGPPVPVMKSLADIAPGTCISSLPFIISEPGQYTVCGDLTCPSGQSGITILTSGVTLNGTGGTYINFLTQDEGPERIKAALGKGFERLAEIKAKWDPQNVFRTNRNIEPAKETAV